MSSLRFPGIASPCRFTYSGRALCPKHELQSPAPSAADNCYAFSIGASKILRQGYFGRSIVIGKNAIALG